LFSTMRNKRSDVYMIYLIEVVSHFRDSPLKDQRSCR